MFFFHWNPFQSLLFSRLYFCAVLSFLWNFFWMLTLWRRQFVLWNIWPHRLLKTKKVNIFVLTLTIIEIYIYFFSNLMYQNFIWMSTSWRHIFFIKLNMTSKDTKGHIEQLLCWQSEIWPQRSLKVTYGHLLF